jgi:DNA helicase IV
LVPNVDVAGVDPVEVARLKADLRMVDLVAAAVTARQRVPDQPVTIRYGAYALVLTPSDLANARNRARRTLRRHNRARYAFAKQVLRLAVGRLAEIDAELAADAEVARDIMTSDDFREVVDACWPRLTATALIAELFTADRLAEAGAGLLSADEQALLVRAAGDPWTAADVPIVDEAWALLGDPDEVLRRAAERRRQHAERLFARQAAETTPGLGWIDPAVLAERFAAPRTTGRSVAERAANDPDWEFGHIVVDEAQELSPMAWRMLVRRCPMRSMTIVGDLAQTSAPWGVAPWSQQLDRVAPDRWRLAELHINYRTPREVMDVAADVLAAVDPTATAPASVRDAGTPPRAHQVVDAALGEVVAGVVGEARLALPDGKLAVITPDEHYDEIVAQLDKRFAGSVGTGSAGLDAVIAVLRLPEAKGLEFDGVVVVEPASFTARGEPGLRDLYVALTRPTQRLDVVHTGELPAVLRRLAHTSA